MALYGTWTKYDISAGSYIDTTTQLWSTYSIAYVVNRFIAIGQYSILTSVDGINWIEDIALRSTFFDGTSASTVESYFFLNGRHFFVGSSLFESTDGGYTWIKLAELTNTYFGGVGIAGGMAYNGSVYALLGEGGAILTSPTGSTWTARPQLATLGTWAANASTGDLFYVGTTFVAVSLSADCATSTDGTTWTNVTALATALGAGAVIDSVGISGSTIVAVGANSAFTSNVAASSTNGSAWTSRTALVTTAGWNPAYVSYATGHTNMSTAIVFSTTVGDLIYTVDGTAWTRVSTSPLVTAGDTPAMVGGGLGVLVQMWTPTARMLPSVYVTDGLVPVAADAVSVSSLVPRAEFHLLYPRPTYPETYQTGGADINRGPWVPSTGSFLCEPINADRSLTNYISTEVAGTCIIPLDGLATPPGVLATIKYAMSSITMNTVTFTLKQGATTVATWSHAIADVTTEYTYTLTPTDRSKLTTGSSLTLTVTAA